MKIPQIHFEYIIVSGTRLTERVLLSTAVRHAPSQ